MTKLGYLGIDQYGNKYSMKKFPLKELKEVYHLPGKASKIYTDCKNGDSEESGYKIGDLWIDIFRVYPWK